MNDFSELHKTLPPMFTRSEISRLLGGAISSGYLANLDSRKQGPPSVRIGPRKVGYLRESFIEWLSNRKTKTARAGCTRPGYKRPLPIRFQRGIVDLNLFAQAATKVWRGGKWISASKAEGDGNGTA